MFSSLDVRKLRHRVKTCPINSKARTGSLPGGCRLMYLVINHCFLALQCRHQLSQRQNGGSRFQILSPFRHKVSVYPQPVQDFITASLRQLAIFVTEFFFLYSSQFRVVFPGFTDGKFSPNYTHFTNHYNQSTRG